jgi:hypothetical protein
MNKGIISALVKALKADEAELSSALLDDKGNFKAEAGTEIEKRLADHSQKLISDAEDKRKTDVENIQKKTTAEINKKWESAIKSNLSIENKELKGDELIAEIPNAISKVANAATDDPVKIKATPTYIEGVQNAEKAGEARYKTKLEEVETKLKETVEKHDTEKTNSELLQKGQEFLGGLKLWDNLPKEAVDAMKETAEKKVLEGYKYARINGVLTPVDENGHAVKDSHGHTLTVDAIIQNAYAHFTKVTATSQQRGDGSGGNSGGGSGSGKGLQSLGINLPKTIAEHEAAMQKIGELLQKGTISNDQVASLSKEASDSVTAASSVQ